MGYLLDGSFTLLHVYSNVPIVQATFFTWPLWHDLVSAWPHPFRRKPVINLEKTCFGNPWWQFVTATVGNRWDLDLLVLYHILPNSTQLAQILLTMSGAFFFVSGFLSLVTRCFNPQTCYEPSSFHSVSLSITSGFGLACKLQLYAAFYKCCVPYYNLVESKFMVFW